MLIRKVRGYTVSATNVPGNFIYIVVPVDVPACGALICKEATSVAVIRATFDDLLVTLLAPESRRLRGLDGVLRVVTAGSGKGAASTLRDGTSVEGVVSA